MNLVTVQFFSPALGRHVTYSAILPEDQVDEAPVLYQLHGRSDDHTACLNMSHLVVYAREVSFIIVHHDRGVRFWPNYLARDRYETFVIEGLDSHVRRTFRV